MRALRNRLETRTFTRNVQGSHAAGAVADVWPGYAGIFIRHPRDEQQGDGLRALAGGDGRLVWADPHWAKRCQPGQKTYNARSETVTTSQGSGRLAPGTALHHPAEAFYEPDWRSGRAVPRQFHEPTGNPWVLPASGLLVEAPTPAASCSMSMLTVNADQHHLMKFFTGQRMRSGWW